MMIFIFVLRCRKVLGKLGYELGDDAIKCIVDCQPNAIEQFLIHFRKRIEQHGQRVPSGTRLHSDQPEVDQDIQPSIYRFIFHNFYYKAIM